MMHTVQLSMRLTFIQTAGIYFQAVMIQPWKYGTWDRDIFFTHCMATRVHQHQQLSHRVEIILLQEEETLLSWCGKVILMKMSKSLSKILEPNQHQQIQEEYHLLLKSVHQLQRNLQLRDLEPNEELPHKNQSMELLLEQEEIWTMITLVLVMTQMLRAVAVKNWLKLLKKL